MRSLHLKTSETRELLESLASAESKHKNTLEKLYLYHSVDFSGDEACNALLMLINNATKLDYLRIGQDYDNKRKVKVEIDYADESASGKGLIKVVDKKDTTKIICQMQTYRMSRIERIMINY